MLGQVAKPRPYGLPLGILACSFASLASLSLACPWPVLRLGLVLGLFLGLASGGLGQFLGGGLPGSLPAVDGSLAVAGCVPAVAGAFVLVGSAPRSSSRKEPAASPSIEAATVWQDAGKVARVE